MTTTVKMEQYQKHQKRRWPMPYMMFFDWSTQTTVCEKLKDILISYDEQSNRPIEEIIKDEIAKLEKILS